MRFLIAFLLLIPAGFALGHEVGNGGPPSVPSVAPAPSAMLRWTFEPWVVACLAAAIVLYLVGAARLWRRSRQGRSMLARQTASFAGGWCALVLALVSPLDALGGWLFSAHMLQHELLMIVAAPLLVLGRPFGVWLWAMPAAWRQAMGGMARSDIVAVPWRAITNPTGAWLLHAAALWLWHVPALFQAALADNGIHVLQHISFLASALLFWWAVLGEGLNRPPRGASILYLFTTMMHTGALGALLTVSGNLWYPAYAGTSEALGLEPIEDQQLGGLIMWVPGGLAYVFTGLMLCSRWLTRERGPVRAPAATAATGAAERQA